MTIALTIIVTLSISIFVVKIATIALHLTGLSIHVASFQALSAFSGTGFTTSETEQTVNYPVRRKIIVMLMVIGNLGLVAILSTVIVGFLTVEKEFSSLLLQIFWIVAGVLFLWALSLSKRIEQLLNRGIKRFLLKHTELGKLPFSRLLQIGNEWSVCEHKIAYGALKQDVTLQHIVDRLQGGEIMALKKRDGETLCRLQFDYSLQSGDSLIVFASESVQMNLFDPSWLH